MKRFCNGCGRWLALRNFDLVTNSNFIDPEADPFLDDEESSAVVHDGGMHASTCRTCVGSVAQATARRGRTREQHLEVLESRHQTLFEELIKIDAEIVTLGGRSVLGSYEPKAAKPTSH